MLRNMNSVLLKVWEKSGYVEKYELSLVEGMGEVRYVEKYDLSLVWEKSEMNSVLLNVLYGSLLTCIASMSFMKFEFNIWS